jgi:hypothetical protein
LARENIKRSEKEYMVKHTSELKHLLGYLGGDDTSSARGRDKAHGHGTALASYLE